MLEASWKLRNQNIQRENVARHLSDTLEISWSLRNQNIQCENFISVLESSIDHCVKTLMSYWIQLSDHLALI